MLDFLEALTERRTWERVLMVIVGALLMWYALMRWTPIQEFTGAMRQAGQNAMVRR